MTTDRDQLREALEDIAEWLDGFATLDLDEIAADNGITVGMVCQQEARWRATKCRRAALATTPDQAVMDERERCAKVADQRASYWGRQIHIPGISCENRRKFAGLRVEAERLAAAIRAQGEPK